MIALNSLFTIKKVKSASVAVLFLIGGSLTLCAQVNLQNILDQAKPLPGPAIQAKAGGQGGYSAHLSQFFHKVKDIGSFRPDLNQKRNMKRAETYPDTLIVGVNPYDTVVMTGTLTHTGPIFVALNGLLIIKHANLTNLGDLDIFNNGRVIIDSSTVTFPQSYFYQRSLVLVNKANVTITNSTLNYGGMSHSWLVADTATLSLLNVTETDWATTGLYGHGTININRTSEVGEIVITGNSTLNIKHSTTALLWHQFPDTANINWSFGNHDTAYGYQFNKAQPGVRGVEYNVHADSVYNVMWAMMPSASSNVAISNSKIRAIGLWFDRPHDSVVVSGITDNAIYSNFTAPLADRTLSFTNCSVKTWSFYVFYKSVINVAGCIAGEIGSENSSRVYGGNYVVDGSGGYHWTTDTSVSIVNSVTVYSYVRSERNSIFLFAYGNVSMTGGASAINNSLLIFIQSQLPADPTVVNGAAAELDNINQPGMIFADSIAPINGSAWIHRGPTSNWMHFKNRQLFYRSIDSINWIPVSAIDTNPASNSLLANWNTHSLTSGAYQLDLRITDNWNNKTDAILPVTLYPKILGLKEISQLSGCAIYPNPAYETLNISVSSIANEDAVIELENITGQRLLAEHKSLKSGNNIFNFGIASLSSGEYICRIITSQGIISKQLTIAK